LTALIVGLTIIIVLLIKRKQKNNKTKKNRSEHFPMIEQEKQKADVIKNETKYTVTIEEGDNETKVSNQSGIYQFFRMTLS
jgi:hypothetical protein